MVIERAWQRALMPPLYSNVDTGYQRNHKGTSRTFHKLLIAKWVDISLKNLKKTMYHIKVFHLMLMFLSFCVIPCESQGEQTTLRYNVLEGEDSGTRVGDISEDQPHSGPFFYVPSESEYFNLESSGLITTKKPLDRETVPQHQIIAVSSTGGVSITIQISVSDINDNSPQFPRSVNHVQFSENAAVGERRPLDSATDPDLNQFSVLGYRIISGNTGETFTIDTITLSYPDRADVLQLDLVLNRELDRETVSHYDLMIEAYDGGSPPRNSTLHVSIEISDINEHAPVFVEEFLQETIPETAPVGFRVVQVNATDRDSGSNGMVIYGLSPVHNPDELFRIDPLTGEIFVNKELSFEDGGVIELVVTARDNGTSPQEELAFVTIIIENVNDEPPRISIIFTNNDGSPKISEAAAVGDFVARISVSDPDGESALIDVTVTGGQGQFDLLTRDNIIYLICVAEPLDREEVPSYSLVIRAVDSGGLASEEAFTLVVEDVNDNPPVFDNLLYEASKREDAANGTLVTTVQATDRDAGENAEVRYSIINFQDDFVDWFKIDPVSGMITTDKMLDRESSGRVVLTVMAFDLGRPTSLNATTSVTIIITDVNDNFPRFSAEFYNHSIPEDIEEGTCFLQVVATDADDGSFGTVTYSMGVGHGSPTPIQFSINADSGHICTTQELDRDGSVQSFEFPVTGTDGGGLNSVAIVRVFLMDVNDNAPEFYPESYAVDIYDYSQIGTVVTSVVAEDRDSGRFGSVTYSIVSGNNNQAFRIDQNTGDITVARTLDRNQRNVYLLEVSAIDGGGMSSVVNAQVTVSIIGPDDPRPFFPITRYAFAVPENSGRFHVVGVVEARNSDAGNLSPIEYRIHSGDPNGFFSLNPTTGEISVQSPPDHEVQAYVLLNVQAASGDPPSYASAQVNVTIEDINDNAPSFASSVPFTYIPENTPLGSVVFIATATDPDAGQNGEVRYHLVDNSEDTFSITPATGHVKLLREIDFDQQEKHSIVIRAYDQGIPELDVNLTFSIFVSDFNDNGPQFNPASYQESVIESLEIGARILQVTATDRDAGNNAAITFSLSPTASGAKFGIFPDSGWIYLHHHLDFELENEYLLEVVATDNGEEPKRATAAVHIIVLDANDNPPHFEREIYTFAVDENLGIGSEIGTVVASDRDSLENGRIMYQLDTDGPFVIGGVTGFITTTSPLDYETQASYKLEVTAMDSGYPQNTATATIFVQVNDLNDNAPVFSHPTKYRASVKEDEPTETAVIQIVASDADSGVNGNITYAINPGVEEFEIDPATGLTRTARILDRESQSHYSLLVTASDGGIPSKTSSILVEVNVIDVNDNAPSVDGNYTFTVDESAPPKSVVGTIAAFDSDAGRNGMLYYSITEGNIYGMFAINRSNGDLVTTREVDYEVAAHHHLTILVEDQGSVRPHSVTVFVEINVLDANDNGPVFPLDPVYLAVVENAPRGHSIWTFHATDPDSGANGEIRYRLVPDQAHFDVDPVSGVLMVSQPIDREMVSEFHFTVKAEDQALNSRRLYSSVSVVCIVADENDNTPTFTSRTVTYVMEDEPIGYPIIHITAEDGDAGKNGQIIYQITAGNGDGKFALGPDTGLLTIAHSLDHEHKRKYVLNITARDQGIAPRVSWQTIEVYTEDVNDEAPVFGQSTYVFNISEGQAAGAVVGHVTATDADTGLNGELTFEIPGGIANNFFQISPDTGIISTTDLLDRETQDLYSLTVYVMDGAFPSHYDVATVVVNVVDINDNPPMFATDFYSLSVPEAYHTDVIHVVTAFDPDSMGVEGIEYQLAGGNEGNSFRLDPQSGELTILSSLDRETIPEYNLTILAIDSNDTQLRSTMVVNVIVLDINDNDPVFDAPIYRAEIPENAIAGTSVVTVSASDRDAGLNGAILYSLDEMSNRLFSVDEITGEVITAGMFDFEKHTSHSIQVRATDQSSFGPRSEQVQVMVTITDVNDNAPVFTKPPIRASVHLGTIANTIVATLEAEDKDSGENGEIRYRFVQSSAEFMIQGQGVKTKTTLTVENFYQLEVEAYDMGSPSQSTRAMLEIWVTNSTTGTINFTTDSYQATVSEDAVPDTLVRFVSLTQTFSNVEFSIASGNEQGAFKLSSSPSEGTATILVQDSSFLDYESEPEIILILEAQAPSGQAVPYYGYTTVTITLIDANDNAPQFTQDRYSTFVLEGNEPSRFVTQVSATDADEGSNSDISFHITGGNTNNAFVIDTETGIIMTNGNLDRETQDVYRLTLKARDDGTPRREDTVMMKITINDANDNKPTFPIYEPVRISEGLEIGSVVTRVTANDADTNPTITYAFSAGGNPGRMFNVDAYSGTITLAEPLDREHQSSYHLVINASDMVHTDQTTIVVNVLDENDNAPVFTAQSYQVTLAELTPRGQHVITVNASDADTGDNARIRYSIGVPPVQAFTINEVTGAIYTDQVIEYNVAQPVIQLVIAATDLGVPSLSQVVAVRIEILDVNNNAPAFVTSLYEGTVPENAPEDTIVVTLTARDDDVHFANRKIDYSIVSGNENQTFFISADSGVITVYNPLDRENREVYTLIVMAADRGSDQKNSTAEVVIEVLDVNDNPPVFSPAGYSGEISESAEIGTEVLRVNTFDMDKGENAEVRYDIKSGNVGGYFVINETSGMISVRSALDHETMPEVRLVVIATDRGIHSLSSTVIVNINISDENDNRPYFPVMMYLERVAENTPPGVIFTAEAHDKDAGIYGQLEYSIIGGNGLEFFDINPTTGDVSSKEIFDYEEVQSYILIIRAMDSGQDSVQVQAQVSITGVDEFAPEFESSSYQFSVSMDAQVDDEVGQVSATDQDSGPDGVILFSFQIDQEHFAIDEKTGVVTVKKEFNPDGQRTKRAAEGTYPFIIIASSGKPSSMVARVSAVVQVVPTSGTFPSLVIALVTVVVFIFLFVLLCLMIAVICMRRKEKQPSQNDNLNRSVSPRSYDATFDQHVEMGRGIINPNITENHMLNMGSYSPRVMYGVPPTNSSMEVGHLTKTDISDQSHSASSGRGSVTVEDEEIRQINERTTVPHQPRDVLDSGIQPDHEDGSHSMSDMNSPRSKPFSTSVESMHVFGEEGGGEAGGQIGHLIYAHLDEAITDEDIAVVDGANVFGYNNEGQPSMGGSLSSIVNSEEEFSGSYNWDYLLDWGPQFQPLAHVFAEIAKLKDDSFVPKSENRTYPQKAFQPLNKTYPPPLITNVVHGPIKQLNQSVKENNSLNQSHMVHSNLPRSPISYDHSLIPAAVTPDLSPSLSPLAPGSPSLSPLVTSTGVSSSQSSRRNSGSKSFSSPRTPRGGIMVTVPPHLMNEPEIQI